MSLWKAVFFNEFLGEVVWIVSFTAVLSVFMEQQIKSAVGERRRLLKRERHGENLFLMNVWRFLGIGFDGLEAEYQFRDFKGKVRFADFVYFRLSYRFAIEIDGFEMHVSKMDRDLFIDSSERQNSLTFNEFTIVRFSYDQIVQKPMECVEFLKALFDKLDNQSAWMKKMSIRERLVIQFALRCGDRRFMLREVMTTVGLGEKTVRQLLRRLVIGEWLIPVGESERIRYYRINPKMWNKTSGYEQL